MYVDTDILYTLLYENDPHRSTAVRIMDSKERKYSSIAALIELEFVIKRQINEEESMAILEKLENKKIEFKSLDIKAFELSVILRKSYSLGIMDSLHAACALLNDKRIASTDAAYDRVAELERLA